MKKFFWLGLPLILSLFIITKLKNTQPEPTSAKLTLQTLDTAQLGTIRQLTVNEQGQIFAITDSGQLWQLGQPKPLLDGLSPEVALTAQHGRIAAADASGNFLLWTPEQVYRSAIPLAKEAGMVALRLATIAVSPQNGDNRLVRIGLKNGRAVIEATSKDPVLPDSHPYQVNLTGQSPSDGHIAVLAKPDSQTYQHGVLGDSIEAQEIQYLERHDLTPLAEPLSIAGLVFEGNRLTSLNQNGRNHLVSVMSGQGQGGRTVLVGLKDGKLQLEAQSQALPSNRWQSPFVFDQQLYAVHMPHLRMLLVAYKQDNGQLRAKELAEGLSNHAIHSRETNLAVETEAFALIPQAGYQSLALLDKADQVTKLPDQLPAPIIKTFSYKDKAYLLLENGQIWLAQMP